jgi:hypothetical protein
MKMGEAIADLAHIRRPSLLTQAVNNIHKPHSKPDKHNCWGQYAWLNHDNAFFVAQHLPRSRGG